MDIKDVFQTRRSVRKFKNQPISDDIIKHIGHGELVPYTDTCVPLNNTVSILCNR